MKNKLGKLSVLGILLCVGSFTVARHQQGYDETREHKHEEQGSISRFHQWADEIANTFIETFIPLRQSMDQHWPLIYRLILVFFAGFIVSLTPCIYPLIPVTAGILRLQARGTTVYNFAFSLFYALGLALTFSLLGTVVASFGIVFGQWLTNPLVVGTIVLFFLYLAFSLFGFYTLYIPGFLQKQPGVKNSGGSLLYAFFIGLWSGLIASPCATPALALMIGYVATTESILQGFLLLFFYTVGFCILLIAIGTSVGLTRYLPQPGKWMVAIERLLGFLMFALCVYILDPLIPSYLVVFLYVLIFISAVVYYINFFSKKS